VEPADEGTILIRPNTKIPVHCLSPLHATLTDVIPDRWASVEQRDSVSSRQERRLVNAVGDPGEISLHARDHELMALLPTFDVAAFRTEPDITSAAAAFGEGPKPHMSFVDVRLAKRQLSGEAPAVD